MVSHSSRLGILGIGAMISILPGSAELAELAANPLVVELHSEILWIDLTSTAPDVLGSLDAGLRRRGCLLVAAPMRGSVQDAVAGTIRFWMAGSPAARLEAQPLLDVLGGPDAVTIVGDEPAGAATVKLLSNLLWFGQVVATTETLLLGQSLGLEPGRLVTRLRGGPGGSVYLEDHVDALLDGDYLETFSVARFLEMRAGATLRR